MTNNLIKTPYGFRFNYKNTTQEPKKTQTAQEIINTISKEISRDHKPLFPMEREQEQESNNTFLKLDFGEGNKTPSLCFTRERETNKNHRNKIIIFSTPRGTNNQIYTLFNKYTLSNKYNKYTLVIFYNNGFKYKLGVFDLGECLI